METPSTPVAVNKNCVSLLDDTWDVLGVCFLFGHGSEPERYTAYVGEAGKRSLRTRLREHVRHKENWNRALLITSDSREGFDWHVGRRPRSASSGASRTARPGPRSLRSPDQVEAVEQGRCDRQ
ncbi:MAG: hypothetical protein QOC78_1776 [Solirubrobacteraceae bacterium]|jgi:hypothetical protein|nr:hypothetical protein [Solirubrobacteraceae bacterium]